MHAPVRSRMIRAMRFPAWFMCVLVVCQLCLGSAWAHASFERTGTTSTPLAANTGMGTEMGAAPCHEAAVHDVPGVVDLAPTEHSLASCCSAAHCYLCSAAGTGVHLPSLPAPVQAVWVSLLSTEMASQAQPPELRPPI